MFRRFALPTFAAVALALALPAVASAQQPNAVVCVTEAGAFLIVIPAEAATIREAVSICRLAGGHPAGATRV
jgi:hypothetical protein